MRPRITKEITSTVMPSEPETPLDGDSMSSEWLHVVSIVLGWVYFVAWSASFYPQVSEALQDK
jgi:hypothetical protein